MTFYLDEMNLNNFNPYDLSSQLDSISIIKKLDNIDYNNYHIQLSYPNKSNKPIRK
jgi:hypothetical protein